MFSSDQNQAGLPQITITMKVSELQASVKDSSVADASQTGAKPAACFYLATYLSTTRVVLYKGISLNVGILIMVFNLGELQWNAFFKAFAFMLYIQYIPFC